MIENLQTIKAERDDYKRRFEELKIESEVSRIVDSLPAGYDHAKIRRLADDSLDVFQLDENENVLGYLILISRNITLDYIKKHGRVRELYEHEEVVSKDDNDIDKTILLDKVREILKKDQLEIFTLHVLSDLTFEEIAKILKRPLGTVLWSYNSAIKKLRKEIKL